ncbi:MAG: transposase family protein [Thermomicrobiales bacterium]
MQSTRPCHPLSVSPSSLAAGFGAVPDPRRAARVISPLPVILALAVAAILANHLSVLAIAEWGARQSDAVLAGLGCPTARPPCRSTRQRLFRQLDGHASPRVRPRPPRRTRRGWPLMAKLNGAGSDSPRPAVRCMP